MKHFKYSPPHNDWAVGHRRTVQAVFRWATAREPRPTTANSLSQLRYDRSVWDWGRKPNRAAVGLIRAFGSVTFFRGCYQGAEND